MSRVLLVAVAAALLAAGCTGGGDEPEGAGSPSPEVASETVSIPSPSPTSSPSSTPEVGLPAEFEQDSDGNAIPDFLEEAAGYDPLVDDCTQRSCPGFDDVDPAGTTTVDQNVMLLLDLSGSMAGPDGSGAIKIDAARAALERYAYGVPPNFRLGLQVFGHRGSNQESGKADSCAGIDLLSPLGSLTADGAAVALQQFQPTGYTPIAAALQQVTEAFAGTDGASNRVILVTDGIETCDGDPVAAAATLKAAGIAVTVDVVGFDVQGESDVAALRAIADIAGGTYTDAQDAAGLDAYVDDLLAQGTAILDSYVCISAALLEVQQCATDLSSAAERELSRLSNELVADEEYELAQLYLGFWGEVALPAYRRQYDERAALRDRLQEDLLARFTETRLRYEQRYGRPVAAGPMCSDRLLT